MTAAQEGPGGAGQPTIAAFSLSLARARAQNDPTTHTNNNNRTTAPLCPGQRRARPPPHAAPPAVQRRRPDRGAQRQRACGHRDGRRARLFRAAGGLFGARGGRCRAAGRRRGRPSTARAVRVERAGALSRAGRGGRPGAAARGAAARRGDFREPAQPGRGHGGAVGGWGLMMFFFAVCSARGLCVRRGKCKTNNRLREMPPAGYPQRLSGGALAARRDPSGAASTDSRPVHTPPLSSFRQTTTPTPSSSTWRSPS